MSCTQATTETRPKQRDRHTREEPGIGTIHEPGGKTQFIRSDSGTVHKRPVLEDSDGFALYPVCGQVLPGDSLWTGIDAETAEEVARQYHKVEFCTKCFTNSLKLGRIGREARDGTL